MTLGTPVGALAAILEPLVAAHDGRGGSVRFQDRSGWKVNINFKGEPGRVHIHAVRGGVNFNKTITSTTTTDLATEIAIALERAAVVSTDLFHVLGSFNTRARLLRVAEAWGLELPESVGVEGPDPDLPIPHPGMSPEDKGSLLMEYVANGASVAGLNFSGVVLSSEADLTSANLKGGNFQHGTLEGVKLKEADLRGATLLHTRCRGADLERALLHEADLRHGKFEGASMRGVELHRARVGYARLMETDLREADLQDADLRSTSLRDALLDGAVLRRAVIDVVTFRDSSWTARDLTELRSAHNITIANLDAFPDDVRSQILAGFPRPSDSMSPREKGVLLLRYLKEGKMVSSLPFWGADLRGVDLSRAILFSVDLREAMLDGADLREAHLAGADLQQAYLNDADLQGADLSDARLWGVRMRGAKLGKANLSGANLEEAILLGADLEGAVLEGAQIDHLTYDRSHWTPGVLRGLIDREVRPNVLHKFPPEAQAVVMDQNQGLTLTFDTCLHRFDPAAFDILIGEVLADPNTDVTIEGRSNIGAEGPAFIRINGSNPSHLVAVAEAFYNRVWETAQPAVGQAELLEAMSSGFSMILSRLSHQRDHLIRIDENCGVLSNPDVKEMWEDQGAAHILAKDKKLLQTRFQKLVGAVKDEAQARVGVKRVAKALGGEVEDAVKGLLPESED